MGEAEMNQGDFQLRVKLMKLWLKVMNQRRKDDLVARRKLDKNGRN